MVTVGSRLVSALMTPSGSVKSALKTCEMSDKLALLAIVLQVGSCVREKVRPRIDQLNRPDLHTGRRRHHWRDSDHAAPTRSKASGGMGAQRLLYDHHSSGCDASHSCRDLPEIQIKSAKKFPVCTLKPPVSGFADEKFGKSDWSAAS